jgi:hypothetical protein
MEREHCPFELAVFLRNRQPVNKIQERKHHWMLCSGIRCSGLSPSNRRTNSTFFSSRARQVFHDPVWYKSGVIYEVHVRAFYDSDADGTGDFRGLTEKLDYIKDLGVTAIWLLPFYPSPLKDDGYDIADYCAVHPSYGTLADFKTLLREAHRRGLRVITELVLNHTSDQHPWFQRARRAKPGSRWRNFYVWSNTAAEYHDARVIFKDVEQSNWTWDHVANAYFWHRFFSHQPDLNYDSPAVHEAMFKVVDFWLDLGVDGLRLDAVPYLYEREGTSCENLPETHAFLKKLRQHSADKPSGSQINNYMRHWRRFILLPPLLQGASYLASLRRPIVQCRWIEIRAVGPYQLASMQPMSRRFGKEFFQGMPCPPTSNWRLGLNCRAKASMPGKRFAAASAFYFNRNRRFAFLQNEIHFMVSFAPIGDADVRAETGIEQMSADAGFNQPSPIIAVLSGLGEER